MVRGLRSGSQSLTWVLAFALALVPSAMCVLSADMTEAQRACCAAMNHDCGGMAVKQDCCPSEAQSLVGFTSGPPPFQIVAPTPVVVTIAAREPLRVVRVSPSAALDSGAPSPSSSPTYLLVSVFRL
ncbi:MAG: hypothetical protein ACRD3C_26175 [Vicinamibacterales bacterium]